MAKKFRIKRGPLAWPLIWAATEWFYWSHEVNDILKRDVDGKLFAAAYDSVDWESYYERLKGTHLYEWAVEGEGILSFGGRAHIEEDSFFSTIGDMSTWEGDWLEENPEFNQVLHDIHVETVGQMIDYILRHAPKKKRRRRRRKRSKAQQRNPVFKKSNSVVIKSGVLDPDLGVEIGGWQGRLAEEPGEEGMVLILWDSITLQNMPDSMIEQCEEHGMNWTQMVLEAGEVERTNPRDTEKDVARVTEELSQKHAWSWLGEEGERIGRILADVGPDGEITSLYAWEDCLAEHLIFPFEAEIAEFQEKGPLQAGERVKVTGIGLVDDLYGIIVDLRVGRRKYAFSLCDLEVVDKGSANYQLVRDYAVWFANR